MSWTCLRCRSLPTGRQAAGRCWMLDNGYWMLDVCVLGVRIWDLTATATAPATATATAAAAATVFYLSS